MDVMKKLKQFCIFLILWMIFILFIQWNRQKTQDISISPKLVRLHLSLPLISIVLPTKDRIHYLNETLYTLLSQTYTHFELVIVNDGSSIQESIDYLYDLESLDKRIRLVDTPTNLGLPNALNFGFKYTKGNYVTWVLVHLYV